MDRFQKNLDNIKKEVAENVSLQTNIAVSRLTDELSSLRQHIGDKDTVQHVTNPILGSLDDMPYARGLGYDPNKGALPGTHRTIINQIHDWISKDSERVFLLLGQAGTGKTAIATTVAQFFDSQKRLGSFVGFCEDGDGRDASKTLFSTIARNLVNIDEKFQDNLLDIIRDRSLRTIPIMAIQFEHFIVKPSRASEIIGPVLIIIDGLDENDEPGGQLVSALTLIMEHSSSLARNYRFLITSRLHKRIQAWYDSLSDGSHANVLCKRMEEVSWAEITDDVKTYFASQLSGIAGIDDSWQSLLVERAEGHFQSAKVICDYIKDRNDCCGDFSADSNVLNESLRNMNIYFNEILTREPMFGNPQHLLSFKVIMATLITAGSFPVTVKDLQSFLSNRVLCQVPKVMLSVQSLFSGVHDLSTPVRPVHTFFFTFLKSPSIVPGQENRFHVEISEISRQAVEDWLVSIGKTQTLGINDLE
ncbi:hypothetical protein Clacol_005459 [Clathrus columnatus]|uniref:NACHT domain-containing protein n=1 Tax=Clathrus columnatus TaxID=1419009 RepID=A0AAV5AC36_9AGAM|nr:hypothetical protein Clacol_005459 [Clathrus columnatus]